MKKIPQPPWGPTRRADALVRMAEAYLSDKTKQSNGGDRYLVHVHTDVETLKADGTGAEAELEDCGHICAETSRRLSCDAGVVHWLEHADGEPLSVGRKTRTIPPAIRRALKRRDGGCRFPGLYLHTLRRCASHQALGGWWGNFDGQSDTSLQAPPPTGARGWFQRCNGCCWPGPV